MRLALSFFAISLMPTVAAAKTPLTLAQAESQPSRSDAPSTPAPTPAPTATPTTLTELPPAPANEGPHYTGAFVAMDVALVALATGLSLEVAAQHDFDELKRTCAPNCTSAQTSEAHAFAYTGYGVLALAGVAAVAAVTLAILEHSHASKAMTTSGLGAHLALDGVRF